MEATPRHVRCRGQISGGASGVPQNRLVRPRDDRWIAGVCAGLARRFGLRPNLVRLLFVLSVLLPGPQVLIYLVLWIIMPDEEAVAGRG
jgi:phage shock protein PspC (stress-responsive transcriptional regulator)